MIISKQIILEYLAHLRVERGLSENTITAYEKDLTQFYEYCRTEEVPLQQMTHHHIREFLVHVGGSEISARTRARKVAACVAFPISR